LTQPHQHTCPSCEYERGASGNPVRLGDKVECLDCGNSWKEFGDKGLSGFEPSVLHERYESLATLKPVETFEGKTEEEPTRNNTAHSGLHWGMAAMISSALMLVVAIGGVIFALDYVSSPGTEGQLGVNTVSFEELQRPNGGKIVRVRGQISNGLATTANVPRVRITLLRSNGEALAHWFHTSKIASLEAGASMRFMTAFPVNAPVIASVEAVLER